MNCPICKSPGKLVFIKNDYKILKCLICSHLYTGIEATPEDVNIIYSDDYFFKGGDGYPDYTKEMGMLIKHGEYYARKIKNHINTGVILDVGSAAGFILKGFENLGWKGIGIEPNASMIEFGKEILKVELHQGTLETVHLDHKFDLVIMIQVIAHLFDLHSSLKNINNLLKKDGRILIETWNSSSLTAKLFGKHWHEYSPPSTLNYFSKKSLNRLMGQYGFMRVATGWPEKKINSNHAKSLLKHKMEDTRLLRKISGIVGIFPDNVLLPYPAEDLFWALYCKTDNK